MQERPEDVPTGDLPRCLQSTVDRTLVGTVAPGTRVTALAVYSIAAGKEVEKGKREALALRQPYLRCAP